MIVSDAAGRKRNLAKADVCNAYPNGRTQRPKRAMRCPAICLDTDEDGTEMVLVIGPPQYGEHEAGREWYNTLAEDLTEFGWQAVENVPCLWTFENETNHCILGTIVDDMLFSESGGFDIFDATVEFLRGKYPSGVKSEREPTAYMRGTR